MPNSLQRISLYLTALVVAIAAFAGTALSANAAGGAPDSSIVDVLRPVWDLFLSGKYAAGSAATLVLAVALVRRYAPGKLGKFVHTDHGGALLTLIGSFGAAMATALAAGSFSLGMLWSALGIAVAAAGGYTMVAKLLAPLEAAAPAWLRPVFRLITWILDKPDPVAEAEAAGAAAVEATPSTGAAGVVGEITELK